MLNQLAIALGSLVGFALGLTGSGGGILAVPMLVFGLQLEPREAVGVSLATVCGMAMWGAFQRWRQHEVDLVVGLYFAGFGALGTPLGAYLSHRFSEAALLVMFALLMLVIATRMWCQASALRRMEGQLAEETARQQAETGHRFSASRLVRLAALGLGTGVMASMFGIGGGFVVVPALVLLTDTTMHRAVGTSLFVIVLVSLSGVGSYLFAGGSLSPTITMSFMLGGLLGMHVGSLVSRRLSGPLLQQIFASLVIVVASYMMIHAIQDWQSQVVEESTSQMRSEKFSYRWQADIG